METMNAARLMATDTWAERDSTAHRGTGARAARVLDDLHTAAMKEIPNGTAEARTWGETPIAKDGQKAMEQADGPAIRGHLTRVLAPRTRAAPVIRRVRITIRAIDDAREFFVFHHYSF